MFLGRGTILSCKDGDIVLGDRVNIGFHSEIFSGSRVEVGQDGLFAAYTYLVGGGHEFERGDVAVLEQARTSAGITLGDNVWLGAGAKVMDGVTPRGETWWWGRGRWSPTDLPDGSVAVGVPARVVRTRGAVESEGSAGSALMKSVAEEKTFTTISGRRHRAPLHARRTRAASTTPATSAIPGSSRSPGASTRSMYRGRAWTMRQFAGFGSARQTNERFKYLLAHGSHGLSVAFDLPTLMGRDPDHPLSLGEVGKCGVAVTSLRDMETLFDGIPLDQVSTSMTINSPGGHDAGLLHPGGGEAGRGARDALRARVQADILKEFIAQKEYIFPPRPSMRIIVDMIRYCTEHMPKWNSISISGYHIREAGSHRGPGAGLHPARRHRVRAVVRGRGDGRGQLRPPPLLLLQLPLRLLRGDREVPGGPAHLGAHHEGALRREEPALVDAAASTPRPRG